jgi:prepilin peptidase CpaA
MSFIALLIFPIFMAYAASSDLLTMRLPNRLTASLIIAFLVMAGLMQMTMEIFLTHLACGLFMLLLGFGMFSRGWIGGGDAKLAVGIALWLGWPGLIDFLLLAAMAGGVMSLIILQWRRMTIPALLVNVTWLARLHNRHEGVPYGVPMALAALHVYAQAPITKLILQI